MPRLSIRQRCLIVWRLGQGVPQRRIAAEVPCSQGTVSNIGRQWLRDRSIEPRHAGGRRRKTTREEDERIIEAGIFYKFKTIEEVMTKIREELNLQINVSVSIINRRLLGNFGILRVRVTINKSGVFRVRVTINKSEIFRVRVTIGNSENGSTIIDNSRGIFRVWVNFGIFKVMQNFLENGLRSRIMAKKPRLTENTKKSRDSRRKC